MGFKLYLLYGVLVLIEQLLKGSKGIFFLHVWDFGKSLFDGADPRMPSKTHPVVMMRQLTLGEAALGSHIDAHVLL